MNDKTKQSWKVEFNIPGDNNTFVANASTVNISGSANVVLVGEELAKQDMILFGDIQISLEDHY